MTRTEIQKRLRDNGVMPTSQRIEVAEANATAVEGENRAKITIANSDAARREREAEAEEELFTVRLEIAQACHRLVVGRIDRRGGDPQGPRPVPPAPSRRLLRDRRRSGIVPGS